MIPEILVWWKRFIGLGRSAYPAFLDTMASNFFCKTASTGEDDDDYGGDDDLDTMAKNFYCKNASRGDDGDDDADDDDVLDTMASSFFSKIASTSKSINTWIWFSSHPPIELSLTTLLPKTYRWSQGVYILLLDRLQRSWISFILRIFVSISNKKLDPVGSTVP